MTSRRDKSIRPRPNPAQKLTGYLDARGKLTDWGGAPLGWMVAHEVRTYRNRMGDKSVAVVLVKRTPGRSLPTDHPIYAGGYALVDNGSLFRGQVVGTDLADAKQHAIAESDYWGEQDAHDQEASDAADIEPDDETED